MHSHILLALLAAASSTEALAGGDGHGSPLDLIAPAVNVIILVGFLVWKLKAPLRNHFVAKSEDVSNTLERANLKSKEAQLMLENEQKKLNNLQAEMSTLAQQSDAEVAQFEKKLARETEEKTQKLKADAASKIEADKKALLDELNEQLLNDVIAKTKQTIKSNKDMQATASSKLMQRIQ
jgi:F-type H+-transporting ATPase subunit b